MSTGEISRAAARFPNGFPSPSSSGIPTAVASYSKPNRSRTVRLYSTKLSRRSRFDPGSRLAGSLQSTTSTVCFIQLRRFDFSSGVIGGSLAGGISPASMRAIAFRHSFRWRRAEGVSDKMEKSTSASCVSAPWQFAHRRWRIGTICSWKICSWKAISSAADALRETKSMKQMPITIPAMRQEFTRDTFGGRDCFFGRFAGD